ncbi:MAG: AAA family ATPase [Gammaproteobacteria bacterium]|nr:AAA family ATPase [Gammaproteobacteria bacterium]
MYRDFFGFTDKPFQLSPDSRFYYNSKPHNRAMAYLRYGLEKREGFIVITGGVGTGKTMLARQLLSELESSDVLAVQLVTTQVAPEDLLRIVCASFGLDHEGAPKATLLDKLEKFFRARHAEGKRVLLMVDEVQNIPVATLEELRMLSNFQYEGKSLLQSFLLGQIEFDRILKGLDMEQFRQRVIAALHLKEMDAEETRNYIEYRLHKVGWKDDPQITAGAFENIYDFTGGVPRRINTLCDRMLLFGCLEERHLLDEKAAKAVIKEIRDEGLGIQTPGPANQPVQKQRSPSGLSAPAAAAVAEFPGSDNQLIQRINGLEQEIQAMKKMMIHEKKLLRKAILIQMDLDIEEDID